MSRPTGITKQAYFRLGMVARKFEREGWSPGLDVSMFRALRELHRVLSQPEGEEQDPHRLVRGLLFHGLSEFPSWTEVPESE